MNLQNSQEQQDMLTLADRMWEGYFKTKVLELLMQSDINMKSFVANVKTAYNATTKRIAVQRPFDSTAISVACAASMRSASVGDKVICVSFGFGGNSANTVVLCAADFSNI